MIAWNVYLGARRIDTVYYTANCNKDYVRSSLIDHDGYSPNIVVRREGGPAVDADSRTPNN